MVLSSAAAESTLVSWGERSCLDTGAQRNGKKLHSEEHKAEKDEEGVAGKKLENYRSWKASVWKNTAGSDRMKEEGNP